jgi:hypothetical protein
MQKDSVEKLLTSQDKLMLSQYFNNINVIMKGAIGSTDIANLYASFCFSRNTSQESSKPNLTTTRDPKTPSTSNFDDSDQLSFDSITPEQNIFPTQSYRFYDVYLDYTGQLERYNPVLNNQMVQYVNQFDQQTASNHALALPYHGHRLLGQGNTSNEAVVYETRESKENGPEGKNNSNNNNNTINNFENSQHIVPNTHYLLHRISQSFFSLFLPPPFANIIYNPSEKFCPNVPNFSNFIHFDSPNNFLNFPNFELISQFFTSLLLLSFSPTPYITQLIYTLPGFLSRPLCVSLAPLLIKLLSLSIASLSRDNGLKNGPNNTINNPTNSNLTDYHKVVIKSNLNHLIRAFQRHGIKIRLFEEEI